MSISILASTDGSVVSHMSNDRAAKSDLIGAECLANEYQHCGMRVDLRSLYKEGMFEVPSHGSMMTYLRCSCLEQRRLQNPAMDMLKNLMLKSIEH